VAGVTPGPPAARTEGLGETIFAEMSALATATSSINLGQGFPDADGPPALLAAAQHAIDTGHN
jgi:N-succinyldiaminopimelate aminotransferase